jgi:hypothetical protein
MVGHSETIQLSLVATWMKSWQFVHVVYVDKGHGPTGFARTARE